MQAGGGGGGTCSLVLTLTGWEAQRQRCFYLKNQQLTGVIMITEEGSDGADTVALISAGKLKRWRLIKCGSQPLTPNSTV